MCERFWTLPSGCFRLERLPGGTCTHWKSAALSRRTPKADFTKPPPEQGYTQLRLLENKAISSRLIITKKRKTFENRKARIGVIVDPH
jgi:hypothetical protein